MSTGTPMRVYETYTDSGSYELRDCYTTSGALLRPWSVPPLHTHVYHSDLTQNPVFSMSRSELINTWVARFGEAWVSVVDYQHDEFWGKVAVRMHAMHLLETHNLNGFDGGTVCRIILEK